MKLAKYSPARSIIELRKYNSPLACLSSGTLALSQIRKEEGEDKVLTVLEMWIVDINDFFNIQNKMKPGQIKETALMILQDFYYMNIADLNLVFTNAKKGKHGALYASLDGSKIYQWFDQHDKNRANAAYRERLKEHDIIKSRE